MKYYETPKVVTLSIDKWDKKQEALIIAENKEWLITLHIPVDYSVDGYRIYNKKFITKQHRGNWEKLRERVFSLKNTPLKVPTEIDFLNTETIIRSIEKQYNIFEFQDDAEDESFFGYLIFVENNIFKIDFITPKGMLDQDFDVDFKLDQIRYISFGNDYFEAMRLLYLDCLTTPTP